MRFFMRFLRSVAVALLLPALLVGCDSSGTGEPDPGGEPFPRNALYVANQSSASVTVISTETNAVVDTLDLTDYGFTAPDRATGAPGAKPHHVVVEPDGSAFYVSLISDDVVAKFSRQGELLDTAPFTSPGMMALAPGGDLLYVTHTMSIPSVPPTVAAVRRSDMTVVGGQPIETGIDRPHGVGVHPGGAYAYAASLSKNRLAVIDTETQTVTRERQPSPLQRYVHFSLSPEGARLYATGQTAGQVSVFDVTDPAAPQLTETVDVGAEPFHPVLTDDGGTLYVPNKGDNSVTALDTETLQAETITGAGLAQPHGSALAPDGGRYLYISNNNLNGAYAPANENGTVVVIDTRSPREIVNVIEVGRNPRGIGTRR